AVSLFLHSFPTRRSSDLAFLVELLDPSGNNVHIVFAGGQLVAGGGKPRAQVPVLQRQIEGFVEAGRILQVEQPAILAVSDERRRSEEHTSELQSLRHLVC